MEGIEFTIHYKGTERQFLAVPKKYGYTFRIEVKIDETPVIFEPDEEGQVRALLTPSDGRLANNIDPTLIEAIAAELQEALR